ncbi:hypothetical protein Aduo_016180 [Ancylostoma duodenale]
MNPVQSLQNNQEPKCLQNTRTTDESQLTSRLKFDQETHCEKITQLMEWNRFPLGNRSTQKWCIIDYTAILPLGLSLLSLCEHTIPL